jgi:predicted trehalose synthase
LVASKESDSDPPVPTVAEEAVYQQWADGLAQRAQEISDPNLATTAVQVADAAAKFVAMLPRMRAEAENHAPGAPAPPSFLEMTLLNKRIGDGLSQLADACS